MLTYIISRSAMFMEYLISYMRRDSADIAIQFFDLFDVFKFTIKVNITTVQITEKTNTWNRSTLR